MKRCSGRCVPLSASFGRAAADKASSLARLELDSHLQEALPQGVTGWRPYEGALRAESRLQEGTASRTR